MTFDWLGESIYYGLTDQINHTIGPKIHGKIGDKDKHAREVSY